MATRKAIAQTIAAFIAGRYPQSPTSKMESDAVAALWVDDLADLSDPDLAEAARGYRRSTDPNDRWFPTPGRLHAFASQAKALDPDEGAWIAVQDRIARGRYTVADLLTPVQQQALQAIGGTWALRRAEELDRATLRKRFLGLCRDAASPRPSLGPPSPALRLVEAPPTLRGLLGGAPDPEREATRARLLDRARTEVDGRGGGS